MYLFMKKTLVFAAFVTFVPVMIVLAGFAYPILFHSVGDMWQATGDLTHDIVFVAVAVMVIFGLHQLVSH